MRRQIVSLMFAGFVGLWASLLGAGASTQEEGRETATTSTVAVQRVSIPAAGIRDEAAMVLIGTALIGLGAVVRRAA
jgi:hypothetical protein